MARPWHRSLGGFFSPVAQGVQDAFHHNEIRAFMRLSRKQTVVVYQHYPRTPSSRQAQVDAWQAALRIRSLAPPPRILDSGNRELVILPADHHAAIINDRLATLLASRWAGQIRLGSH